MGQLDYNELLAFILVGFALMGSPGPASLSCAAMGAAYDVRTARNYLFGATFGAMLVVAGVAAGVFAAIIAIPHATQVLTVIATAYLGYLAFTAILENTLGHLSQAEGIVKLPVGEQPGIRGDLGTVEFKLQSIATAPPVGEPASPENVPGFMSGLILNLSNPKAYAAFAALFSGFQLFPQSPVQSTYLQVFVCYAILWVVNPAWLYAGNALRHTLRNEKTSRSVNIGFAVLLVASVLIALLL